MTVKNAQGECCFYSSGFRKKSVSLFLIQDPLEQIPQLGDPGNRARSGNSGAAKIPPKPFLGQHHCLHTGCQLSSTPTICAYQVKIFHEFSHYFPSSGSEHPELTMSAVDMFLDSCPSLASLMDLRSWVRKTCPQPFGAWCLRLESIQERLRNWRGG